MSRSRISLIALVVLAGAACSDSPTQPEAKKAPGTASFECVNGTMGSDGRCIP